MNSGADLIVVANRLPVRRLTEEEIEAARDNQWVVSPGGLVAALAPAVSEMERFAWVGWPGDSAAPSEPFDHDGMHLVPIHLTEEEKELHYEGMSNGTLWPLYHDKVMPSEFHRTWYDGYRSINLRFAEATAAVAAPGAHVWIHDYQLQLVPGMLRARRPDLKIGFFLHIPFPPAELFMQIPWRREIAEGMLGADLLGFQTNEGAQNFHRLALRIGAGTPHGRSTLTFGDRTVEVRGFPIGIDVERYDSMSRLQSVNEAARSLRAQMGNPQTVMLGVDRLDYTKGIDVRLRAFKELLAEERLDPTQVTMIQVAEPSRDNVEAYVSLRERVERLVGEMNGDYGRVGYPVVHYIHQTQTFDELLALYRAADVMLVTPLRDGMNLVAKEYVASRFDDRGSLVLSEFAGAAHELNDALIVNPYDTAGVKAAMAHAVEMDPDEARRRMTAMRTLVTQNDAASWASKFLTELAKT